MATQKKKRKNKPKQSSFEMQGDIKAILLISIGIILAFSTYTNILVFYPFLHEKFFTHL